MNKIIGFAAATAICFGLFSGFAAAKTSDFVLSELGDGSFELVEYTGNDETVVIPGSVSSIGSKAFYDCDSIKEVFLSSAVEKIGDSAFEGASALESVNLTSNLVSIGNYAFADCEKLLGVYVPDSVNKIGACALGFGHYDSESELSAMKVFAVEGSRNSYAQTYAQNCGLPYVYSNPDTSWLLPDIFGKEQSGDINADGNTDIVDVVMIRRNIIGNLRIFDGHIFAADMNKDEKIDIIDVVFIRKAIIEK